MAFKQADDEPDNGPSTDRRRHSPFTRTGDTVPAAEAGAGKTKLLDDLMHEFVSCAPPSAILR